MAIDRLTIYPGPQARAIAAWNSPAGNLAMERYARLIGGAALPDLTREDWIVLADLLNATAVDARWVPEYLVAELEDAHRLDGIGERHYPARPDVCMARLIALVSGLDYVGLCAVLTGVEWFWAHHEQIDAAADEWWTPAFRCRRAAP